MLSWFQCLALSLLAVALLPLARGDDLVAPDDFRIGVASCNNERVRTTLWSVLRERKPQVTALLGDNIYADHPLFLKVRIPATLDDIRRSYARLGRQPDFTALREETDLQATWDDHGAHGVSVKERVSRSPANLTKKTTPEDYIKEGAEPFATDLRLTCNRLIIPLTSPRLWKKRCRQDMVT